VINLTKELNYYPTNAQTFTIDKWSEMLQTDNGFTPVLLEAIYVLVFEMDGKGSAKQISEVTGRSYQVYNLSMAQTVKRLRKNGYTFVADIRKKSKKERYWSHFFNGYYDGDKFVWVVKYTLQEAFIKYESLYGGMNVFNTNNRITIEKEAKEGMRRLRTHYQIERNPEIVKFAKKEFMKKYGNLFCEACNFSFKQTYGIDFIEAHHVLPLYKGKRVTKGIDLVMLCANCHRAVHSKRWNDKPIEHFLGHMKNQAAKGNFSREI